MHILKTILIRKISFCLLSLYSCFFFFSVWINRMRIYFPLPISFLQCRIFFLWVRLQGRKTVQESKTNWRTSSLNLHSSVRIYTLFTNVLLNILFIEHSPEKQSWNMDITCDESSDNKLIWCGLTFSQRKKNKHLLFFSCVYIVCVMYIFLFNYACVCKSKFVFLYLSLNIHISRNDLHLFIFRIIFPQERIVKDKVHCFSY